MNLLYRITRLFKADLHGVLDSLEEPEIILKQAVREMEVEIEQSAFEVNSQQKHLQRLNKQKQAMTARLIDLDNQIGFCFDENNEALAKSLIKKKLQVQYHIISVDTQIQTVINAIKESETLLNEQREKLQSVIDKQALFSEHGRHDWPVHPEEEFIQQS